MTRLTAVSSLVSSVLLGGLLLVTPSEVQAQTAPTPVATTAGGTDHSQVVGTFGVGYMGLGGIAIAGRNIDAPIIGARYWLNEGMGIDAGLGFGYSSSKNTTKLGGTTTETENPSATGILLHGGVPLALATGQHHTFQVVPELNVGYGTQTIKPAGGGDETKNTGFRLDLGARAGTEVQFGFIGLPRLALQATVGLYFTYASISSKTGDNESSGSSTSISTTVQQAPWAIFTNNVSAIYYF